MAFAYPQGATQLDPDEAEGLRLTHISTREELNLFEAGNIREGMEWAWRSRRKDIVGESFIRQLHKLAAIRFSWGAEEIAKINDCRQQYIQALQAADHGDYIRLLAFVRS